MKAFLTGGYGFVGRHLCKELVKQGHELVILKRDHAPPSFDVPATVVDGDLSSVLNLERILAEYEINTVFHLAAQTQVSTAVKNPLSTFEINIAGTYNILEACRRQNTNRIIFASSDKCYGRSEPPYDENTILDTDRPYESSKACADIIARTYANTYGMSIAVTRSVNIYGPGHLNFSTLIPGTIRRVLRNESPVIKGDMARDWLFVEDVISAYVALANSKATGAFCLGSGVATNVKDVIKKIITLMGSDIKPVGIEDKIGEIQCQWSTFNRAKKEINWEPKYTLDQGLLKTIEWYKNYFNGNK